MFCRTPTVPWCLKFIPISCMGLSMHPRTQIWFFNQFICTGACACSSNLNYAHKIINALKTQLMHKNFQTNLEKSQIFTQHSCCSMLTREKNLKAIRGNGYRLFPKVGRSLPKSIMLIVRSSGLWVAYTQTCPKWEKNCTTACWCHPMIACQVSLISE